MTHFSPREQALGTHAYEASQEGGGCAPAAGTGAGQAGVSEGELSADYQLLCQIGNCLQLDTVRVLDVARMRRVGC